MNCNNGSLTEVVYNALWDLYNSTNGIHWTWSTQLPSSTIWTFPSDLSTPCSNDWQGLVCSLESPNSCSLDEISLISYSLDGYLPSSLGNIVSLTSLELARNSLVGSIPSELGNLKTMAYFGLNGNNLDGTIPSELGDLHLLKYMNVESNNLSGTIPSELGNLLLLEYLNLESNNLSGVIPIELGNLQSIQDLFLYFCHLHGTIPSEFGNLTLLRTLNLNANRLTGTIPSELGNLQSLRYLGLGTNNLTGTIPSELGNLQSILTLLLHINHLIGIIPSELGSLPLIQYVFLDRNNLTGTIPSALGNLQSVIYLQLGNNSLTGIIPSELGNIQTMTYLDLGTNNLFGTIPSEVGNLQSIQTLYFDTNGLIGTIPKELGNLKSLIFLDVSSNCLSRYIPSSLGQLQSMQVLSLHSNMLSGTIPSELANLTSMESMLLNSNKFAGEFPGIFENMFFLSSLDLSENSFSGSIFDELAHLWYLLSLSLDNNLFSGTIPALLNFTNLQQLDISLNFISGEIMGLTALQYTKHVFAAQNILSGAVPTIFTSDQLENFDLSDNVLGGSIGQQFFNCSNLATLALGGNSLSGTIPDHVDSCQSLVTLNLSHNELSGVLTKLVFSGSMQSLDLSSNHFSGTLPPQLFQLTSLKDVLLNNNCFSGSLPETMCSNSVLEYLVMNDLTLSCGSIIPKPLRPIFHGEISKQLMSGIIPDCVWGMPGLRLLQLSGNGLTGSIGTSGNNRTLKSLLLAGNMLTGMIPEWIQKSSILEQLDLSRNRLSGTLMAQLVISSAASLFRVSVNRLSGDLPNAIFSVSPSLTLDALNGNQFSCSSAGGVNSWGSVLSPGNLPVSDATINSYVCGSSSFNDYLLFTSLCLLVFAIFVAFLRRKIKKDFGIVVFNDFRWRLLFNEWHRWRALFFLSVLLLILFVSFHSPSLSQFNTHSEQYLWMTTAAFLRGWAPALIVVLVVGMGEAAVTSMYRKDASELNPRSDVVPRVEWCYRASLCASIHLLNIVAVITTNSAYVVATVNGLPLDQLFIIQLSLGCFKLVWNSAAIPWLLRISTEENDHNLIAHRVFMSLFAFIGGPLISTFFTDSSCFLYVVTPQPPSTATLDVPEYACSLICIKFCLTGTCFYGCYSKCQFLPASISATSTSSWIYSYQCSSALLLDYTPVIIASTAISGFLLPCVVMSQFVFHGGVVLLTYLAPRSMLIGDAFDVMQLGRFLQVKTLINLTTMLTFGFASPLLGVLVVLDSLAWFWVRKVLVVRQISYLKSVKVDSSTNNLAKFTELSKLAKNQSRPSFSDGLIVSSFVGVFWSLFVFDMIGDVYGNLSGGLSILTPLLLGAVIWLAGRYRRMREQKLLISRSVTVEGVELTDMSTGNALHRSVEDQ